MHELPIDDRDLRELVRQVRHYDIAPIYLPRYLPNSRDHPISELLGELVEEAFEYLSIASEEEVEHLLDSLPSGMTMIMGRRPDWGEEEQRRRVAVMYVASEVQRSLHPFKEVVGFDIEESEVFIVYPELKDKTDKDGLLHIDDELTLHEGGVEYRDHILYYHQFLRRGFTASPNFDFISKLIDLQACSSDRNSFRIAIDHRRIMPKEFYRRIMEFDTWYGPTFSREKLDDPQEVGLTVIKRNKNSLFDLTNQLDRTEFFWSYKSGIKTFQVEEVSDKDYTFDHYNVNRYAHSERDINDEIMQHVDGAVKVYLSNAYSHRFEEKMPSAPKCHRKIKLWRVDGDIDVDSWVDLLSFFFKGNEMVFRYFNPKQYEEKFELRVRDFERWKKLGRPEENT